MELRLRLRLRPRLRGPLLLVHRRLWHQRKDVGLKLAREQGAADDEGGGRLIAGSLVRERFHAAHRKPRGGRLGAKLGLPPLERVCRAADSMTREAGRTQ